MEHFIVRALRVPPHSRELWLLFANDDGDYTLLGTGDYPWAWSMAVRYGLKIDLQRREWR